MANYEVLAKFYDANFGDRQEDIQQIKSLLEQYKSDARTILELGCGTGSVLKGLMDTYQVSGLDLSPQMLKIAKKKVPTTKLYEGDMSDFHLDEKFDVVLCVFDSINHLIEFAQWESLFKNSAKHLNEKGLLIFDINTIERLKAMAATHFFAERFEDNYLITTITEKPNNVVDWQIDILEHVNDDMYKKHTESELETSFPIEQIKEALAENFNLLEIVEKKRPWFICEKLAI